MISYWNKIVFKKYSSSKFGLSELKLNLSVTVLVVVILNISIKEVNGQGENFFLFKELKGCQNLNWLKDTQTTFNLNRQRNRLDANF